jgi:hypothetical protein
MQLVERSLINLQLGIRWVHFGVILFVRRLVHGAFALFPEQGELLFENWLVALRFDKSDLLFLEHLLHKALDLSVFEGLVQLFLS